MYTSSGRNSTYCTVYEFSVQYTVCMYICIKLVAFGVCGKLIYSGPQPAMWENADKCTSLHHSAECPLNWPANCEVFS